MFKDGRQSLAIARAQGRHDITLLVASTPGGATQVARAAQRLGGEVRYREEEIGYLRVKIPLDRVTEFTEADGIEAVTADVDASYPYRLAARRGAAQIESQADFGSPAQIADRQFPSATPQETQEWPPKWSDYPLSKPYSPLPDIDAVEFLERNPTFDGRGVTIALLDGNFDLLLPEFQTGLTLDGKRVPKVADYLNVTDPRDDAGQMPQWVNMHETVTARGGGVSFHGKTFTTPHDGAFRIGVFSERQWNDPSNAAYMEQDIDRNGNPRGDDGLFGVLWDEKTNNVWVDTDRDLDFRNEKALTDYIQRPEIGIFGKDDPATPYRDTIGFAVQTDPKNKFVSINVGIYQHATEIMGSVVGSRDPNGRLQGVAPGARLISMFYGSIAHAMIEGLIAAFKHPQVDLIVLEQSVNLVSMSYSLSDARHPISIVAQRLIDRYQKLLFVPGDNSPGFGYVAEDGAAPGAVSVGGYQNRESYRINNGYVPEPKDNMHWGALSHGPSGSGALKPDLLAPSGEMSTDIGYLYREAEQELRGLYQLPPGYAVNGGTSTATPMAAGATALVLSAAKQTGVKIDARTLKTALTGSARFIKNLAAHEQGNGLIQVAGAYERLKKLQSTPPVTITSRGPVKTRLSHLLATPDEGVGLYEREGWAVGDKRTRTISFTRTSGPKEPMTFDLAWEGNDGTFKSAPSVVLPLNQPVDFPVAIAVTSPGAHTAILNLDHPAVPGHAHRMLASVVAAYRFSAPDRYTVNAEITVPRPGDRPVFIDVPEGAAALAFSAHAEDGQAYLAVISPSREYLYPGAFNAPADQTRVVTNPEPGVWEINVCTSWEVREYKPSRPKPVKPTNVTVTARIVGGTVTTPVPGPGDGGNSVDFPLNLINRLAPVSAAASTTELGSAFRTSRTIMPGEQHVYEVLVPAGATCLWAQVSGIFQPGADLDVYLIDCTTPPPAPGPPPPERDKGNKAPPVSPPNCTPRAKDASVVGGGEVEARNPAAGRWVIVVDAYAVPPGGTRYSYLDLFTHPKFGSLVVTDHSEKRESGAGWTALAHAWTASLPESTRTLMGRILLKSVELMLSDGTPAAIGELAIGPDVLRPKK